jgi:hypothetical protein
MRSPIVDRMTPKERMLAFKEGKPIDRIPCCPGLENNGIRPLGITFRDMLPTPNVWLMLLLPVLGFIDLTLWV